MDGHTLQALLEAGRLDRPPTKPCSLLLHDHASSERLECVRVETARAHSGSNLARMADGEQQMPLGHRRLALGSRHGNCVPNGRAQLCISSGELRKSAEVRRHMI